MSGGKNTSQDGGVVQTLTDLSRLLELLLALSQAPAAGLPLDDLIGAVLARVPEAIPLTVRLQLQRRLRDLVYVAAPVGLFELVGVAPAVVVRASSELRAIAAGISRAASS